MKPELGERYTREQISKMLGGSRIAYLPHKDGQVLCGCFDPSARFNPGAPEEVIFGQGAPEVGRMAEMINQQNTAIPVFLRRLVGRWEYVGDYLCVGLSRDPKVLTEKRKQFPNRQNGVAGVLYFKKV